MINNSRRDSGNKILKLPDKCYLREVINSHKEEIKEIAKRRDLNKYSKCINTIKNEIKTKLGIKRLSDEQETDIEYEMSKIFNETIRGDNER